MAKEIVDQVKTKLKKFTDNVGSAIDRGLSEFADPTMSELIVSKKLGMDVRFEEHSPKEIFDWQFNSEVSHVNSESKQDLIRQEVQRLENLKLRCHQCGATKFKGYASVAICCYQVHAEAVNFLGKKTKKHLKTVWGFTSRAENHEITCKRCESPLKTSLN